MTIFFRGIIAGLFLLQVQSANAGSTLFHSNTSDTLGNPKIAESYASVISILNTDQTLRSELNATQLKTLSYYDSVYKKSASFRTSVNKSIRGTRIQADNKKGTSTNNTEASRDRKKASLDNIQKLLDILRSMNPQI